MSVAMRSTEAVSDRRLASVNSGCVAAVFASGSVSSITAMSGRRSSATPGPSAFTWPLGSDSMSHANVVARSPQ